MGCLVRIAGPFLVSYTPTWCDTTGSFSLKASISSLVLSAVRFGIIHALPFSLLCCFRVQSAWVIELFSLRGYYDCLAWVKIAMHCFVARMLEHLLIIEMGSRMESASWFLFFEISVALIHDVVKSVCSMEICQSVWIDLWFLMNSTFPIWLYLP